MIFSFFIWACFPFFIMFFFFFFLRLIRYKLLNVNREDTHKYWMNFKYSLGCCNWIMFLQWTWSFSFKWLYQLLDLYYIFQLNALIYGGFSKIHKLKSINYEAVFWSTFLLTDVLTWRWWNFWDYPLFLCISKFWLYKMLNNSDFHIILFFFNSEKK